MDNATAYRWLWAAVLIAALAGAHQGTSREQVCLQSTGFWTVAAFVSIDPDAARERNRFQEHLRAGGRVWLAKWRSKKAA